MIARGCGEERMGSDQLIGYEVSSWGNESILELMVMVGQDNEDLKCC